MTDEPDLILFNGTVLTVDRRFSIAQAVAVSDGHVVAVGSDSLVRPLAGPSTRLIDLAGRTVLPGINDSHLHGAAYGMSRPPFALDLAYPAVRSIADVAATVARAADATPAGTWLVGLGWNPGYLTECTTDPQRLPHRHDLDRVAPDHPVCLNDFSAHMVWANTAALRAAGITAAGQAPPGGTIDVDDDGVPTGILREAAQILVQQHLPKPTVAQRRAAIETVITELHTRGITSYTEPGLGVGGTDTLFGGLSTDNLTAYAELAADAALAARVSVLLLPAPMGGSAADLAAGLADALPQPADPRRLRVLGVKIFGDGVPPNRTAWMSEEYTGGGHGALCVHGTTAAAQEQELREMVRIAHAAGYQVGVHVTGDRAIDTVVDALVCADRAHPRPDARHYIIHGDFIGAGSLAVMAEHGYGVNMNPAIKWTISDLMDELVGPARSAYQWPVRAAFDAGVNVCASSDAPITIPDWRQGVAAMLLRESKATGRISGPDQRVGLADAIRAYTINPARQDFAEDWKGSIEVGKVADLCVLAADLATVDPHDLPGIPIDLTVFDGTVVYERTL
ncbi:amidohydrolase [Actinoplanes sichuanensis]|uniref:Amidohydrolase n=1 Tax=Actinoplanes sichuanensis TaxID=512349 RepID=A0ABW4A1F7_9ACTN|nr:amidohydrolase [Actinoplanes sichuanensis]BEL04267.1 amidohydrolase [Actinoplanes sichuanensis]